MGQTAGEVGTYSKLVDLSVSDAMRQRESRGSPKQPPDKRLSMAIIESVGDVGRMLPSTYTYMLFVVST